MINNLSALSGIVSIILGIVYIIQTLALPRASIGSPMSPLYFPLGLGVSMVVLGIILVVQEALKGGLNGKARQKSDFRLNYTGKLIIFTCIISIIYAILYERAGFIISTIFFLEAILTAINGKDQWKINTIVAVCFSVGIYILFSKILGIILPITPIINI
ncbi:Tripartite tricarboxylate transporter TctB family protein [Clostridium liquoris]|jgi:putative tricarboxylic transport membrane protein|uniref:Tripartite tricarboxylate transporter TctB family protein n=1 Tax=Clostridium liquoris TaxID=1289519 RepID=A0A2T0B9K0_9CLOT|nr:tripartite tricarboxylate transporter TctB family protein [Clostridium liquoris]PRR80576.1 Tripartite tricarboxylate transporter TctB family protein [Clostridium liquoris]